MPEQPDLTEGSLLTAEALAWVGREVELPEVVVSDDNIGRFLAGTGDRNPLYTDDEVARQAGHDAAVVPPLACMALSRPVVPVCELASDGRAEILRPPVGAGRAMAGQLEVECVRPLYRGGRVRGRRRLVSLEEKQGRRRRFVLATWQTEYRDQAGELVVRETYQQILS